MHVKTKGGHLFHGKPSVWQLAFAMTDVLRGLAFVHKHKAPGLQEMGFSLEVFVGKVEVIGGDCRGKPDG